MRWDAWYERSFHRSSALHAIHVSCADTRCNVHTLVTWLSPPDCLLCTAAGKVTVGLASPWSRVTGVSGSSMPIGIGDNQARLGYTRCGVEYICWRGLSWCCRLPKLSWCLFIQSSNTSRSSKPCTLHTANNRQCTSSYDSCMLLLAKKSSEQWTC